MRTVLTLMVLVANLSACDAVFEPLAETSPEPSGQTPAVQGAAGVPDLDRRSAAPATGAESMDPDRLPRLPGATGADAATDGRSQIDGPSAEATASSDRQSEPLPADMLTAVEAERAVRMALDADGPLSALADATDRGAPDHTAARAAAAPDPDSLTSLASEPSYRVIYVQRWPDKSSLARIAEVLVYRYDTSEALHSLVDLDTGEARSSSMAADIPVPMTPDEVAEAAWVARADDRVRRALDDAGLAPDAPASGLLTVSTTEDSACAVHRCIRLLFTTPSSPVPAFAVVVDLNALEVVEVATLPEGG